MPHPTQKSDQVFVYALLALIVWLPLPVGTNRPWSAMSLAFMVALMSIIWAWSILSKPASSTGKKRTLSIALPLFFLLITTQLWISIQWLSGISQNSAQTLHYLILGCSYSLIYLLIVNFFGTRKRLTLLISTLIISGALQAFYGTFMTLSGIEWLLFEVKKYGNGVATGTFVNRNHLAGYLEITIACGIGLLLALRDGQPLNLRNSIELLIGPKSRIRLSLIIMVIALVMTRSRTGNVAFFSSLTFIGGLFILINKQHRVRNGLLLASIILIDILIISQYFGLENLRDRLANTRMTDVIVSGELVQQANVLRDNVLVSALPMVEKYYLTGSGAGSFESVYQQYPKADIRVHFDHAHNDFLQFLIEFGVIGLLPLILFVILSFWHGIQALCLHKSWYRSGIGFGASMGILSLMIHSATDFNLQIPANAATFVILCAIATLAKYHTRHETGLQHRIKPDHNQKIAHKPNAKNLN